jgi:hypothetical protein
MKITHDRVSRPSGQPSSLSTALSSQALEDALALRR